MTPRWLQSNASFDTNANTGGRTDSFPGERQVVFGAGSKTNSQLFSVPLIAAGKLDPSHAYLVKISVNEVAPSTDNGPFYVISDGTHALGFEKDDSSNVVEGDVVLGTIANDIFTPSTDQVSGGAGSSRSEFDIYIHLDPASGGKTNAFIEPRSSDFTDGWEFSSSIDLTKGLSFMVRGNNADETYAFYSFAVTVRTDD